MMNEPIEAVKEQTTEVTYLVLTRKAVRECLTEEERKTLDDFIDRVREHEGGTITYSVEEITDEEEEVKPKGVKGWILEKLRLT